MIVVKKSTNKIHTSRFAIASLVLGILALFPILGIIPGAVGMILGFVALNKIKKTGLKGRNLAFTGIILSFIGIVIALLLILLALNSYPAQESYRKNYPVDADKFIGNNTYENTYYHFRLIYPYNSTFASANPDLGFVVRFFFPNGQKIAGDEENIGVHIVENSSDIDAHLRRFDKYTKNGPVDVTEITLGGQKGYRVEFASDYTFRKGTREMMYFTVKNDILYELNYFPVVKDNIVMADGVAHSFEFTY